MKAVILCGGFGTRFSEETKNKPKPMIKIGEFPILFHIMKIYEKYGINDFVLALGYRGNVIKEFFNEYKLNKLNKRYCRYLKKKPKKINWTIKFCFSGLKTMTGGRILRLKNYLQKEENFLLTYGDGLANVNVKKLIKFHLKNKKNRYSHSSNTFCKIWSFKNFKKQSCEFSRKAPIGRRMDQWGLLLL